MRSTPVLSSLALIAAAVASTGGVAAAPALSAHALRPRASSDGDHAGPYPIQLNNDWVKVQDGVLEVTSSKAERSEFTYVAAHSYRYDVNGTINGYMGGWFDSFGFFRPSWDESQCVRGVSNTTHATHFYLASCVWDDSDPVYGLQLFHLQAGSTFGSTSPHTVLPQSHNHTTDWIPFGETGDTQPDTSHDQNKHPLTGWRFYPSQSQGARLQAQPKDNGKGTTLQFLNATYYNV